MTELYVRTRIPAWLGRTDVPLVLAVREFYQRRRYPRALGVWGLDSGTYFEKISLHRSSPKSYAALVATVAEEVGGLQWAAIQDWPCEPQALAYSQEPVEQHQIRTVNSYLELCEKAPSLPWLPILQGRNLNDYLRCVDLYTAAGVDLHGSLVGIGSVCRRSNASATQLLRRLARGGLRFHAFGVDTRAVGKCGDVLVSYDSMAWSVSARRERILTPQCVGKGHKTCSNCMEYAIAWREEVLRGDYR